jgi:hypothetical protein
LIPFFLFLVRCRKYLSDPTEDVKVATEGVLADFLHEIQEITLLQKRKEEKARAAREALNAHTDKTEETKAQSGAEADNEQLSRGAFMPDGEVKPAVDAANKVPEVEAPHDTGGRNLRFALVSSLTSSFQLGCPARELKSTMRLL